MQTPSYPLRPAIIPFPVSTGNLLNPNVVGFLPSSSNTKTKTHEWKEVTIKWRREQLERARLRLKYRSVFRQLLTLPRFASTPTPILPPTSPSTTVTTSMTGNSTSFQQNMLAKYTSMLQKKQPWPQSARRSMRLLLHTQSPS